jgi:hypothetical protein
MRFFVGWAGPRRLSSAKPNMLTLLGFVPQHQPTICSQLLFSDSLLEGC